MIDDIIRPLYYGFSIINVGITIWLALEKRLKDKKKDYATIVIAIA